MLNHWLSRLFNVEATIEKFSRKEIEFAHNTRDHMFADLHRDDVENNLWQLKSVLKYDKSLNDAWKKGLNLRDTFSYLRKSKTLTKRECFVLACTALSKYEFTPRLKLHPH